MPRAAQRCLLRPGLLTGVDRRSGLALERLLKRIETGAFDNDSHTVGLVRVDEGGVAPSIQQHLRIERKPIFGTVIHRIHDPEGFEAAEVRALEASLPAGEALPTHAATSDHALGICIWEGESVEAIREVVEGSVGPYAKNEYYEMDVDGLILQLGD